MNLEELRQKIRNSRILTFAVPVMVVLGVAAVYEYGYLRVQEEVSTTLDAEGVKSKTLEKYVTLIAHKPDFEKQLVLLKDQRNIEDRKLIEGQTPSLAAATLQNTVKSLITGKSGTISSERVEKPEVVGKFNLVSVSIDAVLPDAKALSDVLYAIETQTPYLVVKELDARIRNFNDPRELTVRLKVAALTARK
jgi:hypothetical protein